MVVKTKFGSENCLKHIIKPLKHLIDSSIADRFFITLARYLNNLFSYIQPELTLLQNNKYEFPRTYYKHHWKGNNSCQLIFRILIANLLSDYIFKGSKAASIIEKEFLIYE